MSTPHHEARRRIHRHTSLGERAADAVARGMGSWAFILLQTLFVAGWMALNLAAWVHHWDPYPWILLNLIFSTQAAYAAPIIMQSQNRQAAKDRRRDDTEAWEVHALTAELRAVRGIAEAQQIEMRDLRTLNDRQYETLTLIKQHIADSKATS